MALIYSESKHFDIYTRCETWSSSPRLGSTGGEECYGNYTLKLPKMLSLAWSTVYTHIIITPHCTCVLINNNFNPTLHKKNILFKKKII